MLDSHAISEQRKHDNVQAVCQAPKGTEFVVGIGSSGYCARLSHREALDLMQSVGQSLKLIHRSGQIEIVGLKD